MIGKQIGESKPVPMAFAKKVLKAREKDSELHYEQKLSAEYVNKFAAVSVSDANKMIEELAGLGIARWKERHSVKVIDLMPQTEEEVKTIFSKESINLKKEDISKILDAVAKFR